MNENLQQECERLRAELYTERAVSESRRKVLAEKADGMRAEWLRAERAEGEVTRLRSQLDATAQAHERDVVRLARALGWTHEPPASVDEVVERAKALHAEALKARTTAERLAREVAGCETRLREERAENARLRAERDAAVESATRAERAACVEACRVVESERPAEWDDWTAGYVAGAMGCAGAIQRRTTAAEDHLMLERNDLAEMVERLTVERDALTRGEGTPSLDVTRAWEVHGGRWLVLWARIPSNQVARLHVRDDARVVVNEAASEARDHDDFARHFGAARWWRVRADGTLAVGESRGDR